MTDTTTREPMLSNEVSMRIRAYYDKSDRRLHVKARVGEVYRQFTLTVDEMLGAGLDENNIEGPQLERLIFTALEVNEARQRSKETARADLHRAALLELEAKITSGELRVVKTADWAGGCTVCDFDCNMHTEWENWSFCPGCGAEIVK